MGTGTQKQLRLLPAGPRRVLRHDKTAASYLQILLETGLIRVVLPSAKGHALVRRPQKTFLDNTTLYHAICDGLGQIMDTGTARELFFLTSAQNAGYPVSYSEGGGDFRIGDAVFEVGGQNKGSGQLPKTASRGFVIKDDLLIGSKNTVPLYLLGFLY